jgi:hypothetical protein
LVLNSINDHADGGNNDDNNGIEAEFMTIQGKFERDSLGDDMKVVYARLPYYSSFVIDEESDRDIDYENTLEHYFETFQQQLISLSTDTESRKFLVVDFTPLSEEDIIRPDSDNSSSGGVSERPFHNMSTLDALRSLFSEALSDFRGVFFLSFSDNSTFYESVRPALEDPSAIWRDGEYSATAVVADDVDVDADVDADVDIDIDVAVDVAISFTVAVSANEALRVM